MTQAATSIGITNFVLVCMDQKLWDNMARFDAAPALLLPRVARNDVVRLGRTSSHDTVSPQADLRPTCTCVCTDHL